MLLRKTKRLIVVTIIFFYIILVCAFFITKTLLKRADEQTLRTILPEENPWGAQVFENVQQVNAIFHKEYNIEIWGDKDIGSYLLYDILESEYVESNVAVFENLKFRFFDMDSFQLDTSKMVIYIGNGRTGRHVKRVEKWLNYIRAIKTGHIYKVNMSGFSIKYPIVMPRIRTTYSFKIGLILIGNELCNNKWLNKYLDELDFVFITYNAKELNEDKRVYRWPLGVANYRSFPSIKLISYNPNVKRPYFCNYIATIYPNSSRYDLMNDILHFNLTFKNAPSILKSFIISTRNSWSPHESTSSAQFYQKALTLSDFTLCPVGLNEETYRIYEALTMGSIPVIEDCPPKFQMPEHAGQRNLCYDGKYSDIVNDIYRNIKNIARVKFTRFSENISGSFLFAEGSYYYDRNLGAIVTGDDEEDFSKSRENNPNRMDAAGSKFKMHRLLKFYKAPVLFVDKIDMRMMNRLRVGLHPSTIQAWRRSLIAWYSDFRAKIREKFVDVINGVIDESAISR